MSRKDHLFQDRGKFVARHDMIAIQITNREQGFDLLIERGMLIRQKHVGAQSVVGDFAWEEKIKIRKV
jgi:hypothetical protein